MIIIYKMDFYFNDLIDENKIDKINSEISKFDFKEIINKFPELKDRIELIKIKIENLIGGEFLISLSDNIQNEPLRQNLELTSDEEDRLIDLLKSIIDYLAVDLKITGFRHDNIMMKNLTITKIIKIGE